MLEAGITDPLCVELVESLIDAMESSDPDVSLFIVRFFATREKLAGVLSVLLGDKSRLLDRIVSENILERLSLGELSGPRLFPIVASSNSQTGFIVLAASLAGRVSLSRTCRATWMQTIESLNSGFDRSEVMSGFLASFRSEGATSVIACHMYVWTQGMSEAVSAAEELAQTDAANIVESALGIDGISDFPTFEFPHLSRTLRHILTPSLYPSEVKKRVEIVLQIMSKIIEDASEFFHHKLTCVPPILSLNISAALNESFDLADSHIDPDICLFEISKVKESPGETELWYSIRPGKFVIEVVSGIVNERNAEIRFTRSLDAGAVEFWDVESLDSASLPFQREKLGCAVVFSSSCPGCPGLFEVAVGDIKLTVEYTVFHVATTTVAVLESPICKPVLEATEINLPISSSMYNMRNSMPTIPLLPSARMVVYITTYRQTDSGLGAKFDRDIVNRMNANEAALRDVIREVGAADTVLMDSDVIDNHPITAGAVIASSLHPVLLVSPSSPSSTIRNLLNEGLVDIFFP